MTEPCDLCAEPIEGRVTMHPVHGLTFALCQLVPLNLPTVDAQTWTEHTPDRRREVRRQRHERP